MFGGARSQPEKLPVPLLLRRRGQMMLSRSSFAGVWGAADGVSDGSAGGVDAQVEIDPGGRESSSPAAAS